MPRADLSSLVSSNRGTPANLLMAGSTVKTGQDIKIEMRYGGQADAGSYAGHMGSIMDNGGAFLQDRVNRRGSFGGGSSFGGGGGANPTARNYGPGNPGGYNWNTVDRGVNFVNEKLKNVNNAMTQSRNDYNRNLIENRIDEIGQQVKSGKDQIKDWNTRVLPYARKQQAQKQAAFNQPVNPKTGKPSKAKSAQRMQGPVMPSMNLNPIPTPWARSS